MVLDPPLSDAQFQELCFANDWFRYERTREGEILMHPPTGGFTSRGNADITGQLHAWWKTDRRGTTYDSNGGFFLPDGSMLSPDAAYVLPQKLKGLTKDDLTGLPYLCPDFIIELRSKNDRLPAAQKKMTAWIANGVKLAWLIDPQRRVVEIYRAGEARAHTVENPVAVEGEEPVRGFVLQLERIWGRE